MAIDLEAIRKKLQGLQTSTTRTSNLWKPEPGKNQVRIAYVLNKKDLIRSVEIIAEALKQYNS